MTSIIPLNIIPAIKTDKTVVHPADYSLRDVYNPDLSLYIHFPFCVDKCLFCPIRTYKYSYETVSSYLTVLKKEIVQRFKTIGYHSVDSIHFGGGTPSLMKRDQIDGILEVISDYADIEKAEILLEAHPKFISAEVIDYLSKLKNSTINFGVQSFDNGILCSMKRHCSNLDMLRKINLAKDKGIVVGIDYICDWPNLNEQLLDNDIKHIESIQPEHISQYPLSLSSGLEKHFLCSQGEESFKQKVHLNQQCEKQFLNLGYNRYSAFHYQKGKVSSHRYGRNQLACGKWIGFGADAYTYLGNVLYINSCFSEYMKEKFILEQSAFNCTERLIWEITFLIKNRPLYKTDIIEKYGAVIIRPIEIIGKQLMEKQYLLCEQDMSLTWSGIINMKTVEKIIGDAFLQ